MSCRPDFAVLVYPAYLTPDGDRSKLASELKVTSHTPPTFMAMTVDDPIHVENVLTYGMALKSAGVSFEMHIYPVGGHGYGLRKSDREVSHWPDRVKEWLAGLGYLKG